MTTLKEFLESEIEMLKEMEKNPPNFDAKICAETNYYGGMIVGYKNVLFWLEKEGKMECKEKLNIIMHAVEKELATTPKYDHYPGKNWEKDADGWRAEDYGVFWDEADSWIAIKNAFMKVEEDK